MVSSPLAINMLLHFHALPGPYLPGEAFNWPAAQQCVLIDFLNYRLIKKTPAPGVYRLTSKGEEIVLRLKHVMASVTLDN